MVDHKTTLYIATLASDYKEGWAYAYEDQLMKLLETLRKWKERKVGRELQKKTVRKAVCFFWN